MSLKKLGRYDLIRVLGKGAMGLVYEGRDPNLDRRVAIKTIKVENLSAESAAEYEVRFRTEARSAARLQHPNIVSVYDSDRDGDVAFLVMEFIEGDDLKHHLDQGERYTLEQALRIMEDLLSALGYAHRQAIVHRDIKPANLLIEPGGRVKLTDFGVARIQDSGDVTRTQGTIVGTLKYMSPEQLQGRPIDARADLFAAGVVLYQLLTGKRPFDGDTDFAVIQQIVGHSPAAATFFNPQLPPALDSVVARSMAKSRDERFATAEEFATALQAACRDAADPTVVPPASAPAPNNNATWTATLRAGESLMHTQPGSSLGSGGTSVSLVAQEVELVYWKDIKESVDVEEFQAFLLKFPSGIYADLARRRLKKLRALPDESDIGFRPGNVNQPGAAAAAYAEATVLLQGAAPARAQALAGDASDHARQAMEATVAQSPPRPPTPPPLQAPAAPVATATPAVQAEAFAQHAAFPPDSARQPAPSQRPVGAQADAAAETMPLPAGQASTGSRRVIFALAGVAVLALAGLAFKMMPAPAAGAGQALPGAQPAASAALAVAPVAVSADAAVVEAAIVAPVAAASAALPDHASPAAAANTAAAAKKAAALERKAAAEKKALADKKVTPEKERPPTPAPERPVAPAAAPVVERAAPAAPVNPRLACEDRMLLGFQICMAEQCAKPAFARHPVCQERRAMEDRRREAERMNR